MYRLSLYLEDVRLPFAYPFFLVWRKTYFSVSYLCPSCPTAFPPSPKIPAPKTVYTLWKRFLKPQGWCNFRPVFSLSHTQNIGSEWDLKKLVFKCDEKSVLFTRTKQPLMLKPPSWYGWLPKMKKSVHWATAPDKVWGQGKPVDWKDHRCLEWTGGSLQASETVVKDTAYISMGSSPASLLCNPADTTGFLPWEVFAFEHFSASH